MLLGTDVSKWQGNVNWSAVWQTGLFQFAFFKISQGTVIDPQASNNYAGLKSVNAPFGGFVYYTEATTPELQALTASGFVLERPGFLLDIWLDVEGSPLNVNNIRRTCDLLENALNAPVGIYTNYNIWHTVLGEPAWGADHRLWIASYPYGASYYDTAGEWKNTLEKVKIRQPTKPTTFPTWRFWQFTDKAPGKEFGITSTYLDLDLYNGELADLQAEFNIVSKADVLAALEVVTLDVEKQGVLTIEIAEALDRTLADQVTLKQKLADLQMKIRAVLGYFV